MTAQSSDSIKAIADAAMRENLFLFLVGAYRELFPDEELVRAPYVEAMCYALQRVAALFGIDACRAGKLTGGD